MITLFEIAIVPIIIVAVIAVLSYMLGYQKCEQKWIKKTSR